MSGTYVPKEFYVIRCGNRYLSVYGDWNEDIHRARVAETLRGAKNILAQDGNFYTDDPLEFAVMSQQDAVIEHFVVTVAAKETVPLVLTANPEKHKNGYFTFDIKAKKKGEE